MAPRHRLFASALVLGVGCLAACGRSADGEFGDLGISEQDARVTSRQAVQAKAIVDSTKAYLPFAYAADGCYARALYMSMELASRRIPTSAQYLSGNLQPSASVAWAWHVAPMVEIEGSIGRTILDPSLAPEGPVSLDEWVRRSNPVGTYVLQWTTGSVYFNDLSAHQNDEAAPVITSFAELPPFKAGDIASACGTMHSYLGNEYLGNEEDTALETKRRLLLGRTRTLANRLSEVGKLDGYSPGADISCGGGGSVPLCREAFARCTSDDDCCSLSCAGTCKIGVIDAQRPDGGVP